MAFENVRVKYGNLAIDFVDGTGFYTFDHEQGILLKKGSDASVIATFVADATFTEIYALEHDGIYLWSLEKSGTSGFTIRKWRLESGLARLVFARSYVIDSSNQFDVYAMALEHYKDTLSNQLISGSSTIPVTDGDIFRTGDRISIGPSTAVGFEDDVNEATVISVVGNILNVTTPVSSNFSPNDPIYFSRSVFVFNDRGPTSSKPGSVYKYGAVSGNLLSVNSDGIFYGIRAATFFRDSVMFVKGGEIIWLDPDDQGIDRSQAIDNLVENRTFHYNATDLTGFGDTIYRLEDRKVSLSAGTYSTETWTGEFNYNTSSVVPEIYFVSVKAEPLIIHRAVSGLIPTSTITVQVLDQFKTPVFNRLVELTSTGGSLSPSSATTDANGVITSTYTANSTKGQVQVEASVS